MQRNLKLYPRFQACASLHFWLPIFFVYFLPVLTVEQVLILDAIYYWRVVLLEVPSGYFSYLLSAVGGVFAFSVAWRMIEPSGHRE